MPKAKRITIKAAHLREDMREARAMIRELAKGIKRDAKALKGKRFSGTPTEHREQFLREAKILKWEGRTLRTAIAAGDCKRASKLLAAVLDTGGAASAEASWFDSRKGTSTRRVVKSMTRKFIAKCLK